MTTHFLCILQDTVVKFWEPTYSVDLFQLGLLLLNGLLGANLFAFIHSGPCSFLDHGKDLQEHNNVTPLCHKSETATVRTLPLVASYSKLWWSFPKELSSTRWYHKINKIKGKSAQKADLHDEKMRVVDIEANRTEQVLDSGIVSIDSIDEILVSATNYNLKKTVRH